VKVWDDRLRLYISLPPEIAATSPSPLLVSQKPRGADISGLPVVPATYADGLLQTDTLPRHETLWLVVGSQVVEIQPIG
jgi:hypothetical protein